MKKILISTIAVVLVLISAYYGYMYYNGPKIIEGTVSKNIDDGGKSVDISSEFSPEDTVYFTAKSNRFWINKAQVVWYKDEFTTSNRFLVEDDIAISNAGYFSTRLSAPEGLEEGKYYVSIYVAGKKIIETRTQFEVKR